MSLQALRWIRIGIIAIGTGYYWWDMFHGESQWFVTVIAYQESWPLVFVHNSLKYLLPVIIAVIVVSLIIQIKEKSISESGGNSHADG
mgnify:CR=1 FL=1